MCLSSSHSSIYGLEHHQRCSICNNPAKIFLTSKFVLFPFPNLTHRAQIEIANTWEATNSKSTGQSLWLVNEKQGTAGAKLNCWAKPAHFDFPSSNINVQGHILSTAGDGLTLPAYISFVFVNCQLCRIRDDTRNLAIDGRLSPISMLQHGLLCTMHWSVLQNEPTAIVSGTKQCWNGRSAKPQAKYACCRICFWMRQQWRSFNDY